MELKPKLIHVIQRAYEEECFLVSQSDATANAEVGTFGHWSLKDIIAHLAAWQAYDAANIDALRQGRPCRTIDDVHAANQAIFDAHREQAWSGVLRYAEESNATVLRLATEMEVSVLTCVSAPWAGERALWEVLVASGYVHPLIHLSEYHRLNGDTSYAIDLWEEAAGLLERLSSEPRWLGTVAYNLACAYSLGGRLDEAAHALREGLQLRSDLRDVAVADADLTALRECVNNQELFAPIEEECG
ncbi:MAG: ClbS/DfsB family four-helix bundle protein [Chloroflexi bacterium]|nr:ClbS/DfsB family four-helix bundle protein [Chloroflexota bacterium]